MRTITDGIPKKDMEIIMHHLKIGKPIKAIRHIKDITNAPLRLSVAIKDEIDRAMHLLKIKPLTFKIKQTNISI